MVDRNEDRDLEIKKSFFCSTDNSRNSTLEFSNSKVKVKSGGLGKRTTVLTVLLQIAKIEDVDFGHARFETANLEVRHATKRFLRSLSLFSPLDLRLFEVNVAWWFLKDNEMC